jgi:hypothetical protein
VSAELTPELQRWRNALAAVRGDAAADAMVGACRRKYRDPEQFRRGLAGMLADHADIDVATLADEAEPEAEPEPEPELMVTPGQPAEPAKPAQRRRAPVLLPDPGLTAVTDSGLPVYLGHQAVAVWLCLLRHANGREDRKVERIGYGTIGDGTGLSRQQVRAGLEVLRDHGIVQRAKHGRVVHGQRLTAEYFVPFPTPARIQTWRATAAVLADDATPDCVAGDPPPDPDAGE